MSCFFKHSQETTINVVRFNEIDNVTYYEILVKCGNVFWTVSRRYKEFEKLHEALVHECSLDKSLLPGKKVLGNRSTGFVKKRQEALEKYLQDIFIFLKLTMPTDFVEFLDFHKYDIIFILRNLAALFATYGENYLARSKHYTFSVLEIYSISERLKLPTPPTEVCDNKYDFSHILDFANMIEGITILPIQNTLAGMNYDEYTEQFDRQMRLAVHKPIGTSSLIPDELKFDLTAFKNIKMLKIYGISTENIIEGTSLRETIEKFYVQKTNITDIKQIVLCDAPVHKIMESESDQERAWKKVKYANFSDNQVTAIDKSINLLPKVTELILDRNCIEKIVYFRSLPLLSSLSLESNRIKDCHDLHMQLGNLVTLNVSQNQIKSLKGFQKLYSLVTLDISCNLIDTVDEVDHIGRLPCLENLSLTGNPVAGSVDYRSRVLSRFGDRLNEIHLDNEKGSGKELDTALALSALRISMSGNSSFTETQNTYTKYN